MHMTKRQIRSLSSEQLRSVVRSTISDGDYSQELSWARDEIDRRQRFRDGVKDAVRSMGGQITGSTS